MTPPRLTDHGRPDFPEEDDDENRVTLADLKQQLIIKVGDLRRSLEALPNAIARAIHSHGNRPQQVPTT